MSAEIRERLCADLRGLQDTVLGNLGTPAGRDRQAETILVDEYNDIVARAGDHGVRSTREADLGLSYRDLLMAIDVQLRRMECPEEKIQLMSVDFMSDLD